MTFQYLFYFIIIFNINFSINLENLRNIFTNKSIIFLSISGAIPFFI
jgi:hypothetical protein